MNCTELSLLISFQTLEANAIINIVEAPLCCCFCCCPLSESKLALLRGIAMKVVKNEPCEWCVRIICVRFCFYGFLLRWHVAVVHVISHVANGGGAADDPSSRCERLSMRVWSDVTLTHHSLWAMTFWSVRHGVVVLKTRVRFPGRIWLFCLSTSSFTRILL